MSLLRALFFPTTLQSAVLGPFFNSKVPPLPPLLSSLALAHNATDETTRQTVRRRNSANKITPRKLFLSTFIDGGLRRRHLLIARKNFTSYEKLVIFFALSPLSLNNRQHSLRIPRATAPDQNHSN
jgi:hypothetical protein